MTHDLLKLAEECESKLMGLAVIRAVAPQLGNTCDELTLTLSKIYAALRAAHEEMRTAREAYTNIGSERDNLQLECDRLRGELKAARQYNHLLATGHDFQCNARDGFECDCGQSEMDDSRRIQYLQDVLKVTAADSIANTVELSMVVKFWPGVTIGQNVVLREVIDTKLKEIDHES